MNAREAGVFMRAFGDGTRLRILSALSLRDLSVAQLAEMLESPTHRVSRHLRYLHARGIVASRTVRNSVVYSLTSPRHGLHGTMLAALQKCLGAIEEARADRAKLRKSASRQASAREHDREA